MSRDNPVYPIIATRTVQVGSVAAIVLAALCPFVPPATIPLLFVVGGSFVTVGLSAYFVATFYPRTTFGLPLTTRLDPNLKNAVALTFDDGPHPETTPQLLDILAAQGAKATFFLVAERAKHFPDLTRRIADEGHTIGVHGLRHRAMVLQSARQIRTDLAEAEQIFTEILGRPLPMRLLRPPHGFKTWTLCRTAHKTGWEIVAWSLDPRDYDNPPVELLVSRITKALAPGDIVLLHECPGAGATIDALPPILQHMAAHGLISVALNHV